MKLSLVTLSLTAAVAMAAPIAKRAVFSTTSYDDLSISGGVAGDALNEAFQKLGPLPDKAEDLEKADQDFLNNVNSIANDAETEAFNPAIEAADGEEADALQRGKIKNKVLKLTATILKLQSQQAQGEDVQSKIDDEMKKLQNNMDQDAAEAGQPSTALPFDATTD